MWKNTGKTWNSFRYSEAGEALSTRTISRILANAIPLTVIRNRETLGSVFKYSTYSDAISEDLDSST